MLSLVGKGSVCLMFPKSDSSEFEELYCSILESVIYRGQILPLIFEKCLYKWVWYLRRSASMKITL